MASGYTTLDVLACLGIAAVVLIGFLSCVLARRKPPGGVPGDAPPPGSQPAPAGEKPAPKSNGRPTPVVVMASGFSERPVAKKTRRHPQG
jgi:hypothetical protein